ncbi:fibrobacter succinogenes major paralogous domain-containing protein [Chryseobacterium sp. EO14]|uniref:fibrobacter succinogenes major paralogous domain-containing protein n=1 Tax=Chryseobacterium sp. EO14 TaxID=2950551 RepID=UPI00210DA1BB|nr:fibrobacter succinogenes major paralogous domain-containing protein [Chryseobacterium sp. EO14]MCQ4139242.1 fibrobacter succinogenes major paralogous domain-containing protein [Chryseobacterium sp. EO14]
MRNLFLGLVLALISTVAYGQNTNAYVAPGDLRTFLDYNLGANTAFPATTPSAYIKGEKFQYGKANPVNSFSWGSFYAVDGSWANPKTNNDPCPVGYRIPTAVEWQGVINNNVIKWFGDFIEDDTNNNNRHTSGLLINNSLFLPAAGTNYYVNGNLFSNNASGVYWSADASGFANYGKTLSFVKSLISNNQKLEVSIYSNKNTGASVRCIKE